MLKVKNGSLRKQKQGFCAAKQKPAIAIGLSTEAK